jgi:hypothetical protein
MELVPPKLVEPAPWLIAESATPVADHRKGLLSWNGTRNGPSGSSAAVPACEPRRHWKDQSLEGGRWRAHHRLVAEAQGEVAHPRSSAQARRQVAGVVEPLARGARALGQEVLEPAGGRDQGAQARLFAEHGYDGTRLDDVAAAAGVTKPVLYRHFDDKTSLYLALLERHRDDLGNLAGAIPASGTLDQRLRAVLEVWLDYVETHAYAWKMLFRDTGGGAQVKTFRLNVRERARATLARLIPSLG